MQLVQDVLNVEVQEAQLLAQADNYNNEFTSAQSI